VPSRLGGRNRKLCPYNWGEGRKKGPKRFDALKRKAVAATLGEKKKKRGEGRRRNDDHPGNSTMGKEEEKRKKKGKEGLVDNGQRRVNVLFHGECGEGGGGGGDKRGKSPFT